MKRNLFIAIRGISVIMGFLGLVAAGLILLSGVEPEEQISNFLNKRSLIMVLCTYLWLGTFFCLYFFVRVNNNWVKTHNELEKILKEQDKNLKRYVKAKKIIDEYSIKKFGLTVEQIRKELDKDETQ